MSGPWEEFQRAGQEEGPWSQFQNLKPTGPSMGLMDKIGVGAALAKPLLGRVMQATGTVPQDPSQTPLPLMKDEGFGAFYNTIASQVNPQNAVMLGPIGAIMKARAAGPALNLAKASIGAYLAKQGMEQFGTGAGGLSVTGLPTLPSGPGDVESIVAGPLINRIAPGTFPQKEFGGTTEQWRNLAETFLGGGQAAGAAAGMFYRPGVPQPTGIRSELTPQDMAAIRAMPAEPYRGFPEVPLGRRLAQFSESTQATQQRRAAAEEQLRRAAEGGRADVQGMPFLSEPRARGEVTGMIGATGVPAERPTVPFPMAGPERQLPEVVASTLRQREAIEQAKRAAEGSQGEVPGMPFVSQEKGQGPVSGAIQTRLHSGINPEDIRPAVRYLGRLLVGRVGDTHADILKQNGLDPKDVTHYDPNRGFVDSKSGNWLDRQETAKIIGKSTADAGGADSMDLPGAGQATLLRSIGYDERQVEDAIRELRTSNVSKEAPPGNLQKIGEEVRAGAETQSLARIEPKGQGQPKQELAPLSTPMGMGRSLKNLINIFLGRAIGKGRAEESGEFKFKSGKLEDMYPDELAQTHDYLKDKYEKMLKLPGDTEENRVAKDVASSLWPEIRNKLFSLGLKKGENVIGATLQELQRERERIQGQLDQQFQSGGKKLQDKAEQALMRDLQGVTELIKKQEGGEGTTRLHSGVDPTIIEERLKKLAGTYPIYRPGADVPTEVQWPHGMWLSPKGTILDASPSHDFSSTRALGIQYEWGKNEMADETMRDYAWNEMRKHGFLQLRGTTKGIDILLGTPSRSQIAALEKWGIENEKIVRQGDKIIYAPPEANLDRNQFYSGLSLPESWEKVKDVLTKPIIGPILDKLYGNEVRREPSEAIRHVKSKWSGEAVPHHVAASEEVANRLVEFASADVTAGQYAKALASEALGSHYKDKPFSEKLGRVIIQDRLDALRQYHQKRGETGLASRVATEMPENEFRQALRDPEIKAALERHKNTVQKVAEQQHTALGGKLAATGPETGTFANLQNILHAENRAAAEAIIYSGNVITKAIQKGSVFDKHATGTAPGYVTDYRTVAQRMVEGNYKRNALRNWLNEGVKAGLYSYGDVGQTPAVRGMKAVSMPVRVKATPWGSQTVKNLWVRADLAPEVSQALSGSGRVPKAGMQMLLDAATELQVIGPTDFTFHTANMFSSVVKSQGKYPNYVADLAARMPIIKQVDAVGRLGWNLYKVLADDPQVQAELARISKIGALRPQATEYSSTLLAKGTGGLLDTAKWIKIFDRAGRLARDKMFDNGVKMKLWEDTELNRREFINRMGQYNAKLMSRFQDIMRSYVSQFVVAGRTFNRNAVESALLLNEVRAASPVAYWKMKMSNALALAATVAALPMVLNSVMTGKPYGRAGTPAGAIDTGKDDDQGRPIVIDLAKTDLTRRGLRITGMGTALEGIRQGDSAEKILGKMSSDVILGQLHPWEGPPIRVVEGYTKELYRSRDPKEAAKAGLMAINPTITAAFSEDETGKRGGFAGVGRQLSTSIGYGPGAYPRHQDKLEEQAGRKVEDMSLVDRAVEEGVMRVGQRKGTPESQAQAAAKKIQSNTKRGTEMMGTLSKADQNWLKSRSLFLPGFDNRVKIGGENVYLTDKEMTRYTELIKVGYEEAIKVLRDNYDEASSEDRQKLFSSAFTEARKAAREQLMSELISESEKDRKGRKFKALQ